MTCVTTKEVDDDDISYLLRLMVEYEEIGYDSFRLACTTDSIYVKDITKQLALGHIIIEHKEPRIPSFREDIDSHYIDIRLTESGITDLEFKLL